MTKAELVSAIADKAGLNKNQAQGRPGSLHRFGDGTR